MNKLSPTSTPDTLWQIVVRKYDYRLHLTFPAYLVTGTGDRLCFQAQIGGVIDHRTRGHRWIIDRPFEVVFWRARWYNVYLNLREDHTFDHFYCNVSLPPSLSDHTITFIDLDLDVRIWPDGRLELLDEDEFIEHSARFAYSPDLQQAARQAVDGILALWQTRQPPFDHIPPG
jgi:protein associated with RNAse G/E